MTLKQILSIMGKISAVAVIAGAAKMSGAAVKLERDARVVSETLPNGVEIVVYKNSEPPNRAAMRLVVRRGSACEAESERGLAHFTEHMAFNGTKHFPAGEMVEYFQRLGMAFGADTNAYTSFDETVYKLDLPDVSKHLVSDGLTLLRDYAGGMSFDADAIEKERGVILAEKDARESQDYRKAVAEIGRTFDGVSHAKRLPIGEESVIKKAGRDDFLKFYRETYRPENIVVVIAGDVNPEEILREASEKFSDFSADKNSPARPRYFGKLGSAEKKFAFSASDLPREALYFSVANASSSSASVNAACDVSGVDSFERRAAYYRMRAAVNALDARLSRIASLPDSRIMGGGASFYFFTPETACLSIGADSPVGGVNDALAECVRQILSSTNLSDVEIEKSKKKIFTELEDILKANPTRKTNEIANDLASAYANWEIYTSPENDLEIARAALDGFDAKSAVAILRDQFGKSKITLFASDAKTGIDGDNLAESALAVASATLWPSEAFVPQSLVFSDFGASGEIAKRIEIEDLNITQIEFKNGVRLNIKKTDFSKDEVLTRISFGGGLMDLPSPEYYFGISALELGGTKWQTLSELQSAKFGRKIWLDTGISGNSFFVSNATTVRDFPDMLRYAATLFRDAAFRKDALPILTKQAERAYMDIKTNPAAALRFMSLKMADSKILSEVPADFESFSKLSMEDFAKWLRPILKNSYMEISVVGAIDVERTIKIFAETFGAGSEKRASEKPDAMVYIPLQESGKSFKYTYDSNGEPRSVALKIWQTCDKSDIKGVRVATILGDVLDDVLRKEIRETEGKVYSPCAYNASSDWRKDWGMLVALTMVAPDFNSEISSELEKCAKKVVESVSEDEFERAKLPIIKGVEAGLRKNSYWLEGVLDLSQAHPFALELARTIVSGYKEVSLDEVRAAAKKILVEKPYSVSIMPDSFFSEKSPSEKSK